MIVARSKSATTNARTEKADALEFDNAQKTMRDTGIQVMGAMPWGTHICVFYETKDDLLDSVGHYILAGLQNNEFCVWAISDPITEHDAKAALHQILPDIDRYLSSGQLEVIKGREWYLKGDEFSLTRITNGWNGKLSHALAAGYDGMRVSGNAFWIATSHWKSFCEYEQELDRSLVSQKMIVLCTYCLGASKAVDILDVARAHHSTIARRNGRWEFLATPELTQARREISRLNGALDTLVKSYEGPELLTARERITLALIVRGSSSKEAARLLGVSPRTVDFHRANVMRKLGAKNVADLVRKVVGE
jgi:DNA-binding CsgD family transcriptional regulator